MARPFTLALALLTTLAAAQSPSPTPTNTAALPSLPPLPSGDGTRPSGCYYLSPDACRAYPSYGECYFSSSCGCCRPVTGGPSCNCWSPGSATPTSTQSNSRTRTASTTATTTALSVAVSPTPTTTSSRTALPSLPPLPSGDGTRPSGCYYLSPDACRAYPSYGACYFSSSCGCCRPITGGPACNCWFPSSPTATRTRSTLRAASATPTISTTRSVSQPASKTRSTTPSLTRSLSRSRSRKRKLAQ